MDLGAIAMKGYSTFSKSEGLLPYAVNSLAGVLPLLQICCQCIPQPQPTRLAGYSVLAANGYTCGRIGQYLCLTISKPYNVLIWTYLCNGYHCRKWAREAEFESWTRRWISLRSNPSEEDINPYLLPPDKQEKSLLNPRVPSCPWWGCPDSA